jgi:AraC-like DNA-binding protein
VDCVRGARHIATAEGSFALVYLVVGRACYRAKAAKGSAQAGDVLLVGPRQSAELDGLGAGSEAVIVSFDGAFVGARSVSAGALPVSGDPRWAALISLRQGARRLHIPPRERDPWARRLNELARELERRDVGFQHAVRAHLTVLLITAARLSMPTLNAGRLEIDPVVAELFEAIDARYRRPVSLEDVARALGRSPRHLSRVVRERTGHTVMHWINERRLEEARRLLLDSDDSVETIAGLVGYGDASHFRRRFRRAHGISPRDWRQLHR